MPWVAHLRMTDQWSVTTDWLNFGRVHHEEQFCEIILNLGQWSRRSFFFRFRSSDVTCNNKN